MRLRALSFFLGSLLALAGLSVRAQDAGRPNVLVIISDDQRWDCLGVVQREQGERGRFPHLRTPYLDRLAQEGTRYRNAFVVCSLCSPSRAAMLTGRYNHANRITGNGTPLPAEAPTYARQLQAAGWRTGYFGKWHMGDQADRPGFAETATFRGQGKYFGTEFLVNGRPTPTPASEWVDDATTGYATNFIKRHAAAPWLAVVGFKTPHGPWEAPDRAKNLYTADEARPVPNLGVPAIYLPPGRPPRDDSETQPGTPAQIRNYLRTITAMDDCVGRLLQAVRDSGAEQRTLVIFLSDNGYYLGEHATGDKRSAYDESLRIPLLIRFPGRVPAGATDDRLVLNLDIGPTILAAGNQPLPADLHGRPLQPLWAGAAADWRSAFLFTYWQLPNNVVPTLVGVRTATHKLIRYPDRPEWTELFDLSADPYETRNLAGDAAHAERLAELNRELDRQIQAVGWTPVRTDPGLKTK